MRNLFFWLRWPAPERALFNFSVLMFALVLVGLGYYYSITPAPVIGFQTIIESQLAELPFENFRTGIFDLTVPANHYTVTERLLGTALEPNLTASYLWLACFAIALSGLLAVVTTASRYYYLGAMGVFILLVVSLKLETLLIFGREDRVFSIFVLLVYGFCSFYIFYFRPEMKFATRFLWFTVVTVIIGIVIALFSKAGYPALHLATNSFPAAMIACILFTVTVAHEIIAAFIVILTRTSRQGKTLNHFLIITAIYLINLVLAYSVKFGFLKWNIITINLYLLLAVSGTLGLWGMRQRQKQMEGIIDVEPHALTGYVLLGTMAMGALAWFMGTANDPAYNAVADVIIFSHLGYGFIFVLYVISNFGGPLSKNMAVHKVLYSPTSMPFFTFRLAGLIATLALAIYNTWQVPAHNAVAGYQNLVADLYLLEGNQRVAVVYYNQGRTYGYANHHSNYALANLAGLKFDHDGEKGFYRAASQLRPTEMSYLNWAQMFQSENDPAGALNVLKEGIKRLKGSRPLSNTLGLLYAAQGKPDSAAFAFGNNKEAMIRSNMIALAARKQMHFASDTAYDKGDSPAMMANKIALASSLHRKSSVPLVIPTDSSISAAQATYLNNYLAQRPGSVDTIMLTRIEQLARTEANSGLREPLLFACALSRYSGGEIQRAFSLMEEVAILSSNKGKYNNILALWCLENRDPIRARVYSEFALSQEYPEAYLAYAVGLTEELASVPRITDQRSRAMAAWDSLATTTDSALVQLARRTKNLLGTNLNEATPQDPEDLYALVRYRVAQADTMAAIHILATLEDANLKARGFLELSQSLLERDNVRAAASMLRKASDVQVTDQSLYDAIRLQERLLLAFSGDIEGLRSANQSPLELNRKKAIYRTYFDALIAEAADDTVRASKEFERLAATSWFFDEGLLAASRYFQQHSSDALRSYKLLADAIQHHPSSIRLRKAYIREAKRTGFGDYVRHAMEELRSMITEPEYRRFALEVGV
jgi:hypothetical protein